MNAPVVRVESDGGIRILTIDRQEKRNALNAQVRERLAGAVREACADPEARVLVFRGAGGKAFVAGADVGEFAERTPLEQRRATVVIASRKPEHLEAHPDLHDTFWQATKQASKVKQSLDVQAAKDLLAAIDRIDEIWKATGGPEKTRVQ